MQIVMTLDQEIIDNATYRLEGWVGRTTITFPSGLIFDLLQSAVPGRPVVHITGVLDLPLYDTTTNAYRVAALLGIEEGFTARRIGKQQIALEMARHGELLITYSPLTRKILNIEHLL